MAKILQGELPARINVIKDKAIIARAEFVDGVYITDDKDVINELQEYGYEVVNNHEEPAEVTEEEPVKEPAEVKPLPKSKKKKEVLE